MQPIYKCIIMVHRHTSDDIVSECVGIQNHIHAITVSQKDTMSTATRTNLEIKGVSSICNINNQIDEIYL